MLNLVGLRCCCCCPLQSNEEKRQQLACEARMQQLPEGVAGVPVQQPW